MLGVKPVSLIGCDATAYPWLKYKIATENNWHRSGGGSMKETLISSFLPFFAVSLLSLSPHPPCITLFIYLFVPIHYRPNSTWLDSTRHDSTRSTCRAHAFWLCRASRRAQLDSLDTTSSTRRARQTRLAT